MPRITAFTFSRLGSVLRLPLLLLWSLALPQAGHGDVLEELPASWQERLQALPQADLSGAEPYARKVIEQQRSEAAHLLADAATTQTDLAEAYGRLGALYHVYHVPAEAQIGYQNAMTLDPQNIRWVYYAGYLAALNGRHAEALELFRTAQKLQPDYAPLALRLGESELELSQLDAAEKDLQGATQQAGLRAKALYLLAQIDLLRRQNQKAVDKLQEVLKLDPKADQAHYPLARALRALGRDDEARAQLAMQGKRLPEAEDRLVQELESLNQGARRFFADGLRATRKQDFKAAAEAFGAGLEIEPENINARVSYARALLLSGEAERAGSELETVLEQSPNHTLALFLSAILQEDKGQTDAAMARYRQVLELEPNHYGAHYCIANRLYLQGDYAQSASEYAAALASNPDIPPARLYVLLALKQGGQSDSEILKQLNVEIEAHPDDQLLRYTRIRLLVLSDAPQVRDLEQARQQINALVQEAFIPPHVELQALVAAALEHFDVAVSLQQQILPGLRWMGDAAYQQAEQVLDAYKNQKLSDLAWYRDDRLMQPPKTDIRLLFREYPSAVPY